MSDTATAPASPTPTTTDQVVSIAGQIAAALAQNLAQLADLATQGQKVIAGSTSGGDRIGAVEAAIADIFSILHNVAPNAKADLEAAQEKFTAAKEGE